MRRNAFDPTPELGEIRQNEGVRSVVNAFGMQVYLVTRHDDVKAMLSGLKGIYVRSYEFGADGAFGATEVESIRRQLSAPGWSRMAGVRSKRDRSDVDVYLWLDGDRIGGLGILATEPRRFTVVNIVGSIDLDQLRGLEGFGLPRLDLERGSEKPVKDKPRDGKDRRPDD
jgi:hypothetical protein